MYISFQHLFICVAHVSLHLERFGASARTTAITADASSSSQIQFNGQYPPTNPACKPLAFSKDTWNQLKLNDHLKQYPGGDKMTLVEYATKLNMTNFVCGVGGACNAGQPCYPLETVDWYILFAVQQWNSYMNVYYEAVGYGIAIVQSSINALIASLFPATDTTAIRNVKANLGIQAAFSQVTGTVMMDVMLAFGSTTGPWFAFFDVLNFLMVAAQGAAAFAIQEPPAPLQDGFYQWSNVAYYLSQYEEVIHKQLSEEGKKRIAAGISTDQGIFGVVKDGNFMEPANFPSLPDMEEQIRNITLALGVNMLLHSINAFITVGSDACNDKGRNGAWPEGDRLSWCDKPGGTMHNIVIAKNDKTHNEINNANVIFDFFGISTELIVTSSIKCQNFNKGWNYIPWAQDKGALPKTADSDCVFNLPVCYTQEKKIRKKIHKKKWTTARACRHSGGLPLDK
ncbi:hypothetical protein H4Q26_016837 [Puccinia striiformis f. sp. tritici PST-130]|nr:hypothetical protein Pst134EB_004228 [Puccinia striiformis f. sp. tritici]KAI9624437.1 hypothetical protein H4Q26_016837 [Puccinia striiformis f. sp. tritici PST-130]